MEAMSSGPHDQKFDERYVIRHSTGYGNHHYRLDPAFGYWVVSAKTGQRVAGPFRTRGEARAARREVMRAEVDGVRHGESGQ